MRYVRRGNLDDGVERELDQLQDRADQKRAEGGLDVANEWKKASKSKTLCSVRRTLRSMAGTRERCMYCLDSHGTDIEHFWPKTPYPERMFRWLNLLLCCAECGRLKSDRFPLSNDGEPLLVDPTAENPWHLLDFDPQTGNIVARYDVSVGEFVPKGLKTVEVLQLDRREALAVGYQKSYERIVNRVREALVSRSLDADGLASSLLEADDHGLLWWCFHGSGQNESPFKDLRERHTDVWTACAAQVHI